MQSLRALLTQYPTLLLIDSASSVVQVALLRASESFEWECSPDEAGTGIYAATETLLRRTGCSLPKIDAFVFCDGPGSVLGIRTAAVAIRTWCVLRRRPTFAYHSLDLVARFQLQAGVHPPFSVIADARRASWHTTEISENGEISTLLRRSPEALKGVLLMPDNFRHWGTLPLDVRLVPYDPPHMFNALMETALFRETEAPDAFLHEDPVYQTWTPKVHRAPS